MRRICAFPVWLFGFPVRLLLSFFLKRLLVHSGIQFWWLLVTVCFIHLYIFSHSGAALGIWYILQLWCICFDHAPIFGTCNNGRLKSLTAIGISLCFLVNTDNSHCYHICYSSFRFVFIYCFLAVSLHRLLISSFVPSALPDRAIPLVLVLCRI